MTSNISQLSESLAAAKWAFTTRRVAHGDIAGLDRAFAHARSGDLVLARVERIGHHKRLQLESGRPATLYVGDLVVLCAGNRYAPDQFEGVAELDGELADLLAGGGLVGRMRDANQRMQAPTQLRPLGLLTHRAGDVVNIADYALPTPVPGQRPPVLAAVGASMNAGKTTAVASLTHGLVKSGLRVASLKLTGTGAFGDFNAYQDAGADLVADFTDAGMPSTYRMPLERIERGIESLLAHAAGKEVDVVVAEFADGIFQRETAALLRSARVRDALSGVMFAAPDALGAVGGVSHLRALGLEPFAVSGMVSCSPLATREATAASGVPVLSRDNLCDPAVALSCLHGADAKAPARLAIAA